MATNNPIITASVVDVNPETVALTGNANKLIKFYSDAKATMAVTSPIGAAIDLDMYIIRNGNKTGYSDVYTFNGVESNVFTFSAEDSEGNIGTAKVTANMVNYIKATCNIFQNKPDAVGNMTVACSGDFFNSSFGAVANTLTVQYRYKVYDGTFGGWANMSVTTTGNTYTAFANFVIPNFNQNQLYSFQTRVIDKLSVTESRTYTVKNMPLAHWGENDFVFEVPVTFNAGVSGANGLSDGGEEGDQTINGNLNVTGDLRLKGSGNYGNTLLFGDGTYCYITEDEDDVMTIKASKIKLNATGGIYFNGGTIKHGTWTPSLNSSAISSYSKRYGWYCNTGQTVTVGFYIKATCNSGWNSTEVTISGLPYTPMYTASGGGMCSGVYVSAGFDFQCFVAETTGIITTRVQSCNHTSATNLSTSASGCFYRLNGGEITLSGTITFIANTVI